MTLAAGRRARDPKLLGQKGAFRTRHPMNRWTVLVMLLLVCVYSVGLVLGWIRNSGPLDWDESVTTQLKNDLADLAIAQDLHRSAGSVYANNVAALADYVPSSGVTVVIENASATGWAASASHRFSTRRCSITARQQRPGELAVIDPPTCTAGRFTAAWNQFHTIKPRTQRFLELLVTVLDRSARPQRVPLVPPGCRAEQVRGSVLDGESDLGYPLATTDRLAVRQMLMDGAFNRLEQLLDAYADTVRRDYRVEYRLFDGYAAFEAAVPDLEPRLDAWVQSHPGSTAARLARAAYYTASAWAARGGRYARETPQQNFARAARYFARADRDIDIALQGDPCSLVAYRLLMQHALFDGDGSRSRRLLEQGLVIQSNTFILRAQLGYTLVPRWGGSYSEVAELARESELLAAINPRLGALAGFAAWDSGDVLQRRGDIAGALAAYNRSLATADFWQFRLGRGKLYYRMKRYQDALEDFDRALAQHPQLVELLDYRSSAEYAIGQLSPPPQDSPWFSRAFQDEDLAARLDSTDADVRESLRFYRGSIPQYEPRRP